MRHGADSCLSKGLGNQRASLTAHRYLGPRSAGSCVWRYRSHCGASQRGWGGKPFAVHVHPRASRLRRSFLGAFQCLGERKTSSGSSRRAACDALACERLSSARCARVPSLDVLLAASAVDLAREVHIPVRACGVGWDQTKCAVPPIGCIRTLFKLNFSDPI